ncbi:hypothetical protein BV25DRAFT_1836660 [Artomyces pyxidatus]|uniref:Uncharacterized protein n=1 Tax=Artomyces pyxidatus TaxID=48021 RepID=A0ACB8T943_9AGAM|nr:hypothetical protein BV25DRAFT_1836660 [Artomyces pyxidatus]
MAHVREQVADLSTFLPWEDPRIELHVTPYGYHERLGPAVTVWVLVELPEGVERMATGMRVWAQWGFARLDGHLGGSRRVGPANGGYVVYDVVGGSGLTAGPRFLYVPEVWAEFPLVSSTRTMLGMELRWTRRTAEPEVWEDGDITKATFRTVARLRWFNRTARSHPDSAILGEKRARVVHIGLGTEKQGSLGSSNPRLGDTVKRRRRRTLYFPHNITSPGTVFVTYCPRCGACQDDMACVAGTDGYQGLPFLVPASCLPGLAPKRRTPVGGWSGSKRYKGGG